MPDYSIFGKNLKRIMKYKRMDRTELSDKSGLSKNIISGYRTGRVYPTSRAIQDIAEALNVEVGELFKTIS